MSTLLVWANMLSGSLPRLADAQKLLAHENSTIGRDSEGEGEALVPAITASLAISPIALISSGQGFWCYRLISRSYDLQDRAKLPFSVQPRHVHSGPERVTTISTQQGRAARVHLDKFDE